MVNNTDMARFNHRLLCDSYLIQSFYRRPHHIQALSLRYRNTLAHGPTGHCRLGLALFLWRYYFTIRT